MCCKTSGIPGCAGESAASDIPVDRWTRRKLFLQSLWFHRLSWCTFQGRTCADLEISTSSTCAHPSLIVTFRSSGVSEQPEFAANPTSMLPFASSWWICQWSSYALFCHSVAVIWGSLCASYSSWSWSWLSPWFRLIAPGSFFCSTLPRSSALASESGDVRMITMTWLCSMVMSWKRRCVHQMQHDWLSCSSSLLLIISFHKFIGELWPAMALYA